MRAWMSERRTRIACWPPRPAKARVWSWTLAGDVSFELMLLSRPTCGAQATVQQFFFGLLLMFAEALFRLARIECTVVPVVSLACVSCGHSSGSLLLERHILD